mmetsp:Transcript_71178/g.144578  ORF Transcript_71178/g.144578 Transcript_71178/m.144578 type:complete len:297 (-) Transcript_71178:511-1401(-)
MSTAVLNSRLGNSTKSMVKSLLKPPKISAIALTPALVPAPSSLKSFTKGLSVMSSPLIFVIAQPSPTPPFSAWPPGSMPLIMAPLPSGRCEMMPKPGDISAGDLKVTGPCVFWTMPFGAIIIFAQTNSGAMISVVPTQLRAKVLLMLLATPKSINFTFESFVSSSDMTRMFSHLRSRCNTFLLWINCKPSTVCLKTFFATSSASLSFSLMKLASSPPGMSSMTIILYCACDVPGLKASQQPMHSATFGCPWIARSTSTSFWIAAIFSSDDGSINKRQMGMVFTARFLLGSDFRVQR